ncbi:hypothetical protein D3C87_1417490 [compost metagenome]
MAAFAERHLHHNKEQKQNFDLEIEHTLALASVSMPGEYLALELRPLERHEFPACRQDARYQFVNAHHLGMYHCLISDL